MPRPVGAMAKSYQDGYVSRTHRHARAQLLYAVAGVMEVTTLEGLWAVPPQRAVWLPPNTDHSMRARGAVALRTLYVRGRTPARPASRLGLASCMSRPCCGNSLCEPSRWRLSTTKPDGRAGWCR